MGWTGLYCDVPNMSCQDYAARNGEAIARKKNCILAQEAQETSHLNVVDIRQTEIILFPAYNLIFVPSLCLLYQITAGREVENVCENAGRCINVGHSHRCQCQPGYTGSYCKEMVDECQSNPCRNGATCKDYQGTYECIVSKSSAFMFRAARRYQTSGTRSAQRAHPASLVVVQARLPGGEL